MAGCWGQPLASVRRQRVAGRCTVCCLLFSLFLLNSRPASSPAHLPTLPARLPTPLQELVALEESGALAGYRASRLEQLQSDAAMLICNLQVCAPPCPPCWPAGQRRPAVPAAASAAASAAAWTCQAAGWRVPLVLRPCRVNHALLVPTLCSVAGGGR